MFIKFEELRVNFEGSDFEEYLEFVLKNGEFEDEKRDKGITQKVLDEGYKSLTEKQKKCFEFGVIKNNYSECKYCSEFTTWHEVIGMLVKKQEESFCSAHEY